MAQRNRQVRVVADPESLFAAAAEEFARAVAESVAAKGSFSVALSGGSTPRGLFSVLAGQKQIAWDKVFFFWGDERHVAQDHPDSNFGMTWKVLLCQLPLRDNQVFSIHGEYADAAQAARDYEGVLRRFFAIREDQYPSFDLVLLGMGPDGHTASLFPGTKALRERKKLVVANWVGKFCSYRITLTPPVLNAGARVVFLVSGSDKAPALKAVLEGPREVSQLPAQLIQPRHGSLLWLVDSAVAQMLNRIDV